MMLKVLTLNLNYYVDKHGPWTIRQELITAHIEAEQPDILAFQAVRSDPKIAGGDDQASQIASRFSYYPYVIFQPAIRYSDGSAEGSAILSKYPISEFECLELKLLAGTDDPTHRVVLHARFDQPGAPFHLFNAHFSWVEEQAKANLEETLPFLESFDGQRMLVGDLNTSPDSKVIRRFEEAGLTDAWAALHPNEDGYTFESGNLTMRIDYVWLDKSLVKKLQAVRRIADSVGDKGARPSDHVGLLVDLSISDG